MDLGIAVGFISIVVFGMLSFGSYCKQQYMDWQLRETRTFLKLAKRIYWHFTVHQKCHCGTWLTLGSIYLHHANDGTWIVRHGSKRGPVLFQKEGRNVSANLAVIPILESLILAHLEGRSTSAMEVRLQNALIKTQECGKWKQVSMLGSSEPS